MKVSVVRGGGLAGVTTRTELDAAALPGDAAKALAEKARAAAGAASAPAPPAHADELSYEVTIQGDAGPRTARFTESTLPEPVRELVEWIDRRPERADEIER